MSDMSEFPVAYITYDTPCQDLTFGRVCDRILGIKINKKGLQMTTYDRILKAQQEARALQSIKDKQVIERMFSNNPRPLNNQYLLEKEEN
jgi:hypothetical protein